MIQVNDDFSFSLPTRIEFGVGRLAQLPTLAVSLGARRVLVVTDPGLVQAGVAQQVLDVVLGAGLPATLFSDVESDPSIASVEAGLARARAEACNVVIAVGGGSAMDAAKAIALMMTNEGRIQQYEGLDKVPKAGAPLIAIPTTAGTGSEVTIWSVLSDKVAGRKVSVGSRFCCPAIALLDPALTLSLPPLVTAATGMDALTHAVESYVNKASQPVSALFARDAIARIAGNLRQAVWRGTDIEARREMMLASLYAGLAFNATRLGLVHALAMPLGARWHIPHGVVNAIMLPSVMRFNAAGNVAGYADIARLFGEQAPSDRLLADRAAAAVQQLRADIGLGFNLRRYGVAEDDASLADVAREAMESGNVSVNPRVATAEDLVALCREELK